MCDFGGDEARYDFNLAGPNGKYREFFSPENVRHLVAQFKRRGYPVRGDQLHPFMVEVYGNYFYAGGWRPGFRPPTIAQMNSELLNYASKAFATNRQARRAYIYDQSYGFGATMPPHPVAASTKYQPIFYNNRF